MKNNFCLDFKLCVDILLTSPFPQFKFLTVDDFIKFNKNISINTTKKELEYLDKKNILKPLICLNREKKSNTHPKYESYFLDSYSLDSLYNSKLLKFYPNYDFKSWTSFMDGPEESVFLFYHSY